MTSTTIKAAHRIITDECRQRPDDEVVAEMLETMEKSIRSMMAAWPVGHCAKIHAKIEIEYQHVVRPPSHLADKGVEGT